jgi:hypothetical protein
VIRLNLLNYNHIVQQAQKVSQPCGVFIAKIHQTEKLLADLKSVKCYQNLVDFKIAVITYKLFTQNQPTYLHNLLIFRDQTEANDLFIRTISISRKQEHNLGFGPFHFL